MVAITPAHAGDDLRHVRALLEEYAASLGISLDFQRFDRELAQLPGEYQPPAGRLLLARSGPEIAGCVALRRIDGELCEMKRLYVRPAFQGQGIGRSLAEVVIAEARQAGYTTMKLDTLAFMTAAMSLYESLGFRDSAPYRHNPIPGTRFMSLSL
jgi:ribosomal protein S18 acetylase RimI-like enzyme